MEWVILGLVGLLCLLAGLVLGLGLSYIYGYKPLHSDFMSLVDKLTHMKKQGFVPQYNLTQAVKPDLAAEIIEF